VVADVGGVAGRPEGPGAGRPDGPGVLGRLAWAATAVFAATAAAAAAFPTAATEAVAVAVDGALFAAGVVALAGAYLRGVLRSRTEEVSVPGVFLLAGAPRRVRRHLLGAVAAQAAVALATAAARPFTPLAFGILVPTFGMGMAGLWGARHASFPPRRPRARRPGRGRGGGRGG
jgi:hypothetical protein